MTYQLESEFKRNRQTVILEGMKELKAPPQVPRLGIFSDAQASKVMTRSLKEVEKRVTTLRTQLSRILDNPTMYDPVYQACQRIFVSVRPSTRLTAAQSDERSFQECVLAAQALGVSLVTFCTGVSARPGRMSARYSRTGMASRRQLSITERMAATRGPA